MTIFFSFVLATFAIVTMALYAPDAMTQILNFGRTVEGWLSPDQVPTRITVWIRFLVDEYQVTYIFFVIVARIVIALFLTLLGSLFNRH
jgi:hypothetical protein